MLQKEVIQKIHDGTITSRKQLYRVVGRSKELRRWLDERELLLPPRWDKQKIRQAIRTFFEDTGRIPKAGDVSSALLSAAIRHYGTWNEALFDAVESLNQKRYTSVSTEFLLKILQEYIVTYQKVPMRSEFDGITYPYWEVYTNRLGVRKWSDVIGRVDLSNVRVYARHGWGTIHHFNGNVYLSREELLIGTYLTEQNIVFEKEVPYGNASFVFDFYLPEYDVYVEYYGIGTNDYRNTIDKKRAMYSGRSVIEIFKHENTLKKLSLEIQRL